jgi:hypothetical protein
MTQSELDRIFDDHKRRTDAIIDEFAANIRHDIGVQSQRIVTRLAIGLAIIILLLSMLIVYAKADEPIIRMVYQPETLEQVHVSCANTWDIPGRFAMACSKLTRDWPDHYTCKIWYTDGHDARQLIEIEMSNCIHINMERLNGVR